MPLFHARLWPAQVSTDHGCVIGASGAENPGKDRVHMLGVIAEVELFLDFRRQQGGGHVRVDVLYSRQTPRRQAWIDILGGLFFFLPTTLALAVLSLPMVAASISVWETSPDVGGLARWPIKRFWMRLA